MRFKIKVWDDHVYFLPCICETNAEARAMIDWLVENTGYLRSELSIYPIEAGGFC